MSKPTPRGVAVIFMEDVWPRECNLEGSTKTFAKTMAQMLIDVDKAIRDLLHEEDHHNLLDDQWFNRRRLALEKLRGIIEPNT